MFSEKGGRECGREGGKGKKRKEIQLQLRYNYKFPTRTAELFVRGTRPAVETSGRKKKEEENGSFVEKLTTPFPRYRRCLDKNLIILLERTNNSTANCDTRPPSRTLSVALFTGSSDRFFHTFFHFFASRRPLSPFLRSARKLPKNMSVRTKPDMACEGKHSRTPRRVGRMKKRRETCRWTLED